MTEVETLFRDLGLVELRRVASGRYLTATTGPAPGWQYFATYRVKSGFWFGVCLSKRATEITSTTRELFGEEGFEFTNKYFEAIRPAGETLQQAITKARLIMDELKDILGGGHGRLSAGV